jgi:hypothetical protein
MGGEAGWCGGVGREHRVSRQQAGMLGRERSIGLVERQAVVVGLGGSIGLVEMQAGMLC